MTDQAHEQTWHELVAAHALHALDDADEQRLLAHLDDCAPCRGRLDEFTLVAAQLGTLADDSISPPPWATIRPRTSVQPLRRKLAVRALAAAAVAVIAAGGAVIGWQVTRPGRTPSPATALAACRQHSTCHVVQLHGRSGDTADVLVEAGYVSLVPVGLPAPASHHMYVLWQLPSDGSPIPVASFYDSTRRAASVPLPTDYADTAAFAVSLEPAGPMPTHPRHILALGAAG